MARIIESAKKADFLLLWISIENAPKHLFPSTKSSVTYWLSNTGIPNLFDLDNKAFKIDLPVKSPA